MNDLRLLTLKASIIADEIEKRKCQKSLYDFTKSFWPVIEPGTILIDNWHIKTICGYLTALHHGELPDNRLIINIPPGGLKSILVSVMYPAWVWTTKAEERFLTISNEQGLAIRDAIRMKQIIMSDKYQKFWPLNMLKDQNEKILFANEKNGFRQAHGITGATTGKRASCFPNYVSVSTEHGLKNITEINVGDNVWSYNIETNNNELKKVTGTVIFETSQLVEVILSNGQIIHCTPDHKFWTLEDGMIEAKDLYSIGFSKCTPNIINVINANREHYRKLFTRNGGIANKDFLFFSNLCFSKYSMLSSKGSYTGNMTIEFFRKFFSGIIQVKNNILIRISYFNNGFSNICFSSIGINSSNRNTKPVCKDIPIIGYIKNTIQLIIRKFSFENPGIFIPFFNSAGCPCFTNFYLSDCSRIEAIIRRDNVIIPSIKTNSLSYCRSNFDSRTINSNRESSMSFGIINILTACSPSNIINRVIEWIPIKMPNFMSNRWLYAMPCRTNGYMDIKGFLLSFIITTRQQISVSIIKLFKNFLMPNIFSSARKMYKSVFASNKSSVTNGVHTLITRNRTPLNVINVRNIGHIDNTYCLCVSDNHNLYVGKEQAVLVSNCLLVDDPIDTKQAFSDTIRQSVNDTYDQTLSTRLNDPVHSSVILIMQRVHESDLTGHLLKKSKTNWTVLSIPMRYEGYPTFDAASFGKPELNDPRTKKGELLFPTRFTDTVVQQLEEDLGEYGASAQLQQRPSPLGGGILKKHWWRIWPDDKPLPLCDHIFLSFDTAFSERDSRLSAYSAMTRWGIFWSEERERYCIMCLGMWYDRVGYDELRRKVQELDKKYKPDILLVEKKATGISLIQDLKRAVPGRVRSYSPGRGEDKISRAHSISPMLESGQVYIPNKSWALGDGKMTGLIDFVAAFPNSGPPSADLTDTCTQALIYLRAGNWSGDHDDDKEEVIERHYSDEYLEDNRERIRFYG